MTAEVEITIRNGEEKTTIKAQWSKCGSHNTKIQTAAASQTRHCETLADAIIAAQKLAVGL